MKKHLVRAAFAASLLCAVAGTTVIMSPTAAIAADKIGKAVGAPLSEAQKLATAGDFQGALAKVKEAQAVTDRTAFEDYKINQFLGFVSIKLNDFASATTAYEAMADSPAMPDEDKKDTLHNVETTGQFVVNAAVADLAAEVNLSSKELPAGESEVDLTGLSVLPSMKVKPPRLAESPVSLECLLRQVLPIGQGPLSANLAEVQQRLSARMGKDVALITK